VVTLRPRAVVRGVGACASLFALVAFAAAAPARAQGGGTSATYDVTFATSGQSIWAPGGAGAGSATIDLTPDLTWDKSGSASQIVGVDGDLDQANTSDTDGDALSDCKVSFDFDQDQDDLTTVSTANGQPAVNGDADGDALEGAGDTSVVCAAQDSYTLAATDSDGDESSATRCYTIADDDGDHDDGAVLGENGGVQIQNGRPTNQDSDNDAFTGDGDVACYVNDATTGLSTPVDGGAGDQDDYVANYSDGGPNDYDTVTTTDTDGDAAQDNDPNQWQFGGSVTGSTTGEEHLYLQEQLSQVGAVSVSYPASIQLQTSDPQLQSDGSEIFTVTAHVAWQPDQASLNVTPTSGVMNLDNTFGFTAQASGQVCLFSCLSFGSTSNPLINVNIPTQTKQVAQIASTTPQSFTLGGFTGPSVSGTWALPSVNPGSLQVSGDTISVSGSDPFLDVTLDPVCVGLALGGAGTTCGSTEQTINKVGISYALLAFPIQVSDTRYQTLAFTPGPVDITLDFASGGSPTDVAWSWEDASGVHVGSGSSVTFPADAVLTVGVPAGVPSLSLTPTFTMASNQFVNTTYDEVNASGQLQVFQLSWKSTGGSQDVGVQLGPLYTDNLPGTCQVHPVADLLEQGSGGACGAAGVQGQSFALGGFSSVSGNALTLAFPPVVTSLSPVNGPLAGGTTLTLQGYRLADAQQVLLGGVPAQIVSDQADAITVVTPPFTPSGPGPLYPVSVQVVGPGGTGQGPDFTYLAPPRVTAVDPVNGPVAGGQTVAIGGLGFTTTTQVFFGSQPALGFEVQNDGSILAEAPPEAAGTVDVRVVTACATAATADATSCGESAAGPADRYTFLPPPTVTAVQPVNGPEAGGTEVTVSGTGFTTATQVLFGTVPATAFQVQNDGSLVAEAPPEAPGTVDVRVVTACATPATADATSCGESAASSADRFRFLPPPTVTALIPDQGPSSGGIPVTVQGSGFTTAVAVYFGSALAPGFAIQSDGSLLATLPPGLGDVPVRVVTACATAATADATSCGESALASAPTFHYVALLALDPKAPRTIGLDGGASVHVDGLVLDDSAARDALVLTGRASLQATGVDVVGGLRLDGRATVTPTPTEGVAPTPDPLAGLPLPSGLPTVRTSPLRLDGSDAATLGPGVYQGGIDVEGHARLTLTPGIYVLQGGGLRIGGDAQVVGSDVLLVLEPGPGREGCPALRVDGSGLLRLGADRSQDDLSVWVAASCGPTGVSVQGQGQVLLGGVLYAPAGTLELGGQSQVAAGGVIVGRLSADGEARLTM
jgi:hypothetical protein